jgi:hypothetical protein
VGPGGEAGGTRVKGDERGRRSAVSRWRCGASRHEAWFSAGPECPKSGHAPLGSVSVAVLDGRIHPVGGRNTQSVGTHGLYDPATNRWSDLTPLPQPRDHMGLVTVGGKLFAVAGRFNTFEYNTNLLDVYDRATNSWSSLKPMPTARSGSTVAVLDGKIFVFGGERLGGTFNQAEAYDPVSNVWAELTPMPMSVHGTGAVTVGDTIYIPAGGSLNGGTAQTNGNESFTLK